MDIEHFALNVPDPVAAAAWYAEHFGMRVVRNLASEPYTHFVADSAGRVVIELYKQSRAPVPNYAEMDPFVFHIAFATTDVRASLQRLLAAGATGQIAEITVTAMGDEMVFLRDPWGVALQLVKRAHPLVGTR